MLLRQDQCYTGGIWLTCLNQDNDDDDDDCGNDDDDDEYDDDEDVYYDDTSRSTKYKNAECDGMLVS